MDFICLDEENNMVTVFEKLTIGSGLIFFGGILIILVFIKSIIRVTSKMNLFIIRLNSSLWDEIFKKTSNPVKKWEKNLQKIGEASIKAFLAGSGVFFIIAGILVFLNFFDS